ncbi:uncharacterized protein LOC122081683 [Macadamia integrifolia]|uniref:uncharacterized protein LOC122081573 n=1 Tax=Macadamia integrifolia TaxID=60698 RepID=UPI001C4EBA6A|nr:uncharacterized protein LOC122081573 [Macadamia integrifolia]XP_042504809.1 uncharacterized protein LOC122081683 [Macadamia integrifolia]
MWHGSSVTYVVPADNNDPLYKWIQGWAALKSYGKKVAREVVSQCTFIAWHIWKARNDYIFATKVWSPMEVVAAAHRAWSKYISTPKDQQEFNISPPFLRASVLASPPPNFHRLRCDASLNLSGERGGIGFLLCNWLGHPKVAVSNPVKFSTILVGEAIAIKEGLMEAISEGVHKLHLESDNQQLISYLQDFSQSPDIVVWPIIEDIGYLCSFFDDCLFYGIPREVNVTADTIARRAQSVTDRTVWPISDPCLSMPVVLDNLSVILSSQ